ncbi:hypothetical protein TrispH2_009601 [Trichoplax sp. H2]|nr:hypothetical protein TrispH2_009601 [Trichoplax sp. H2]|eukprot:RDD38867.1 hypothetical protein TrispH2_009601 [Trichoplax sp. H2]
MPFLATALLSLYASLYFGSCQNVTLPSSSLYVDYCMPSSTQPSSSVQWTVIAFPNGKIQQSTDNRITFSYNYDDEVEFYYIRCNNGNSLVKENILYINSRTRGVILWLDEDGQVIPQTDVTNITLTVAVFPFQLRAKVFGCEKNVLAAIRSPPLNASLTNSFPGNVIEFFQVNYGLYSLRIECLGKWNTTLLTASAIVSGPARATGNDCHCVHNGVCSLVQNDENNQTCYCSDEYTGSKCQWKAATSQQVATATASSITHKPPSVPVPLNTTAIVMIHVALAVLDCCFLLTIAIIYYKRHFPRGRLEIHRVNSAVYTPVSTVEPKQVPQKVEDLPEYAELEKVTQD